MDLREKINCIITSMIKSAITSLYFYCQLVFFRYIMEQTKKPHIIATGLAMFSMFFGAGNVVFPLALGQLAQDKNIYAILGMLVTAVAVPFAGLIAMTLYDGDYRRFFERIGKIPGFTVAAIIMALIGPFGAIPRCIALSYSTAKMFIPFISLPVFSFFSCIIIWLFTFRRSTIVDVLGYYLTPLLLLSLLVIIFKGLFFSPEAPQSTEASLSMFLKGLNDGYQTMDLIGAFFFSSVIISSLKKGIDPDCQKQTKQLMLLTLKASCIGAFLLAAIYVGFSYVAAYNSAVLKGVQADELIGIIANHILGPHLAIIACIAVALACLTTAIALSTVFAEFIHIDIARDKIGYNTSLLITLAVAFFVSTLNFTGIANFLTPILYLCYPALIVLSLLNIMYKLFRFEPIKLPVLFVFIATIIGFFYQ